LEFPARLTASPGLNGRSCRPQRAVRLPHKFALTNDKNTRGVLDKVAARSAFSATVQVKLVLRRYVFRSRASPRLEWSPPRTVQSRSSNSRGHVPAGPMYMSGFLNQWMAVGLRPGPQVWFGITGRKNRGGSEQRRRPVFRRRASLLTPYQLPSFFRRRTLCLPDFLLSMEYSNLMSFQYVLSFA
jgi:hypothetical protein